MTITVLTEELQAKISHLANSSELISNELVENLMLDFSDLSFQQRQQMMQEIGYIKTLIKDTNSKEFQLYTLLEKELISELKPQEPNVLEA